MTGVIVGTETGVVVGLVGVTKTGLTVAGTVTMVGVCVSCVGKTSRVVFKSFKRSLLEESEVTCASSLPFVNSPIHDTSA